MFIRITSTLLVQIDDSTREVRIENDPPAFEVRREGEPGAPGPGECLTPDGDVIKTPRLEDGRLNAEIYWQQVNALRRLKQAQASGQATARAIAAEDSARAAERQTVNTTAGAILEALKWWGFSTQELEGWVTKVGRDRITRIVKYVQDQQQKPGGVTSPKALALKLLRKNEH